MSSRFVVTACLSLVFTAAGLQAQTTTTRTKEPAGPAKVVSSTLTGEVALVEGNQLLVRMQRSGLYRYFSLKPGQQFMIDGQPKQIGDLKPGTMLTATILTTTQPVTVRTASSLNGTVWYVSGNYVILTLDNGENHKYNGSALLQVHGRGQARHGRRAEEGHEGLGDEDRRTAPHRNLDTGVHHGESSQVVRSTNPCRPTCAG